MDPTSRHHSNHVLKLIPSGVWSEMKDYSFVMWKTSENISQPTKSPSKQKTELVWSAVHLCYSRDKILQRHIFMQQDQVDNPLMDNIAHGLAGVDLLSHEKLLQLPDVHSGLRHDL